MKQRIFDIFLPVCGWTATIATDWLS